MSYLAKSPTAAAACLLLVAALAFAQGGAAVARAPGAAKF
jgi:hypothetical protein